jgi:L-asparaginase II
VPEKPPAHLATVTRGTAREAVLRGHIAVVDAAGAVLASAGDAGAVTTARSCVKPLQAQPFVRHALDSVGASAEELAVACASHNGEPVHTETVVRLLRRCGLGADALSCGRQLPYDDASARRLLATGGQPGRIHNNCSGKHAGMLAACVVRGWPTAGYAAAAHPLQAEIREVMGGFADLDLAATPSGIDGCGLPTHGLPLQVLARMFAAAAADAGFARCQEAMAAHPYLVAGAGRFDTALLAAAGSSLTVKGGGAAVWVAVCRPAGPALAIKLEAGDSAAMPPVALAALAALGWIGPEVLTGPDVAPFVRPEVRNWEGAVVGAVTAEAGWARGLAA